MKPSSHNNVRKNTAREKAWKLMRVMRTFTLSDLATLGETDYANIKHYVQCLIVAGYVRVEGKRQQEGRKGRDNVLRLIKNTGPKPPIQKALRFLYDQNSGEYWSENPEIAALMTAQQPVPAVLPPVTMGPDGKWISGRIHIKDFKPLLSRRTKKTEAPHVD